MTEFGRRLGCSRDVIANLEYGRVEPKEVLLDHLCEIYSVNPAWLYRGEGPMFAPTAPFRDPEVLKAAEIFSALSPELRQWALSQLTGMQNLINSRESGGQTARTGAETVELLGALLSSDSMREFDEKARSSQKKANLKGVLGELTEKAQLTAETLASKAGLPREMVLPVLSGDRTPSRDLLLLLSVAIGLELSDAQWLLELANHPALYVKNRRDSAVIFALMRSLTVPELQDLLAELEESPLIGG